MKINTFIERRWQPEGRLYWFTTISFKEGDKWFNCLYLNFMKDDFPWLNTPPLVDISWTRSKKRFDYYNCNVGQIDWHGGITFYEEVQVIESGRIKVKAGCDYQHLYDDDYQAEDSGELILKNDAPVVMRQFDALNERLSKQLTARN